jgi:hypothetical protein
LEGYNHAMHMISVMPTMGKMLAPRIVSLAGIILAIQQCLSNSGRHVLCRVTSY